jgi:hypothetical protein
MMNDPPVTVYDRKYNFKLTNKLHINRTLVPRTKIMYTENESS